MHKHLKTWPGQSVSKSHFPPGTLKTRQTFPKPYQKGPNNFPINKYFYCRITKIYEKKDDFVKEAPQLP